MGGKGSSEPEYAPPPPPVQYPSETGMGAQGNIMQAMMPMMMMMQMQNAMMQGAIANRPAMPPMPQVERSLPIDWGARQKSLEAGAEKKAAKKEKNRYGRAKTIHTSPLLGGEDLDLTRSILTSGLPNG